MCKSLDNFYRHYRHVICALELGMRYSYLLFRPNPLVLPTLNKLTLVPEEFALTHYNSRSTCVFNSLLAQASTLSRLNYRNLNLFPVYSLMGVHNIPLHTGILGNNFYCHCIDEPKPQYVAFFQSSLFF